MSVNSVAIEGADVRLDPTRLTTFCAAALTAAGASDDDAALTARLLVRTDLRGTHSHGVQTLPAHVRNLREGGTRSPAAIDGYARPR
ncbi:MAG: hypothetical protein GEV10_16790 [Streptosporangiales bacterium]|nr:hypothetical protein [Streptosporangiales bacterium]